MSAEKQVVLDKTLENLFNLTQDLLCVADFAGYFRLVNKAFESTLGYSTRELLKSPFIEFVHPEDRAKTLQAIAQQVSGEPVINFENRYRCKDGAYKWLAWTSVPLTDEGLLYAIARDTTEQKVLQQELTRQRDLLETILSTVPVSIFWKDKNSTYLGANDRFARDTGLEDPRLLVGNTDYDLPWTREEAEFYRECDRQVMESGKALLNIEETQHQAGGRDVHLLTSKVPLRDDAGQVTGMLGVYMDITRRKQAEETLRESEARLQTLFDSAAEFIFVIDPQGTILKANRFVYKQSGFRANEVLGSNIRDFFSENSKLICDCNFPDLREKGYKRTDIEFICKDGRIIQMECSASAVPDETGHFSTFLIIQRDVTERNRATAALAISEQRFRSIFNSSYQLIGLLDPAGILLEANQTALDLGGLRQEDVIGRPFWDTYWWRYSGKVQERLKAAIADASRGKTVRYEENVRGRNETIRTIDFTLTPVANPQGETVFIIPEGADITDKKQAEKEMQRHQQEIAHVIRLSTAGEMASGMAHELNQPLTALVSYCGTASKMVNALPAPPQKLRDLLQHAKDQAHRAGRIIHHLREFVSKEYDSQQSLEADQLFKDLDSLLSAELSNAAVKLEYRLGAHGCQIMANKVQIEQVLVNLVRNSVEALRNSNITDGKIVLKTHLTKDGSIEATVSDNGPGIAADMRGKLFNPFQTSKETGMGMGLSISRSIIEAHGGRIWANEHRRSGASFSFTLPVSNYAGDNYCK
jgi:PAS domain S-box-containing protein